MNTESDHGIEILETKKVQREPVQLPMNFITVNETAPDDIKIYVKQDVYREIEVFSAKDTSKEVGGILLGKYAEVHGKMHVLISKFIEAKYTDATAATLTFTHKTWDYIHAVHQKSCPDLVIIGWQHTHPSYGIFLSNYDLFIHQNFFNTPFQVAYVVDPVNQKRGFFQWKNDKLQAANGFYIYDDVGTKISCQTEETNIKKEAQRGRDDRPILISIVLLLFISTIILLAYTRSLNSQITLLAFDQNQVKQSIQAESIRTLEIISGLQQEIDDHKLAFADMISSNDDGNMEQNVKEPTDTPDQHTDATPDPDIMIFRRYVFKEGDNLVSVCKQFGIDYHASANIIQNINGLESLDLIYVGQEIVLPVRN